MRWRQPRLQPFILTVTKEWTLVFRHTCSSTCVDSCDLSTALQCLKIWPLTFHNVKASASRSYLQHTTCFSSLCLFFYFPWHFLIYLRKQRVCFVDKSDSHTAVHCLQALMISSLAASSRLLHLTCRLWLLEHSAGDGQRSTQVSFPNM